MQADLLLLDTIEGLVAGVDEAGRGPLAGDVVTAAVVLDPERPIDGLGDSKVLPEKVRNALFDEIMENALYVHVARATVHEIDHLNILHATMLAMTRAVDGLGMTPAHVFVDGNRLPPWSYAASAIVQGDSKVAAISAASIIAKVTRDREMAVLDREYRGYGFADHKGYGTPRHLSALGKLGPCALHRHSFRPVREACGVVEL